MVARAGYVLELNLPTYLAVHTEMSIVFCEYAEAAVMSLQRKMLVQEPMRSRME